MTKLKFSILITTSIVVSILFLAEILLARQTQAASQQLAGLQRLIGEGRQYYTLWQQLAARTYQLSQQDPALKDILTRQQVTITPKPTQTATPQVPAATNHSDSNPPQ